jgi:hypothetical protein
MAKVHYCRCRVNLAGQGCHIVVYDEHSPLPWPEVQVLMQLHGEENVMDIMPVKLGDVVPAREKERLIGQYGYRVVESVFPGRQFRMGLMMTDDEQLPHIDAPAANDVASVDDEEIAQLAAAPAAFRPGRHAPRHETPRE